jgi:hypothetical protein
MNFIIGEMDGMTALQQEKAKVDAWIEYRRRMFYQGLAWRDYLVRHSSNESSPSEGIVDAVDGGPDGRAWSALAIVAMHPTALEERQQQERLWQERLKNALPLSSSLPASPVARHDNVTPMRESVSAVALCPAGLSALVREDVSLLGQVTRGIEASRLRALPRKKDVAINWNVRRNIRMDGARRRLGVELTLEEIFNVRFSDLRLWMLRHGCSEEQMLFVRDCNMKESARLRASVHRKKSKDMACPRCHYHFCTRVKVSVVDLSEDEVVKTS